jgi:centromere/kinetochore protein ZW10
VDAWIKNAKALQDDIDRSRKLASEIVREADAGNIKTQAAREAAERVEFLTKEALYNEQVRHKLRKLKAIRDLLDEAEELAVERKIMPALYALESMGPCWIDVGNTDLK